MFAYAQTHAFRIEGVVTDPTGAVIPGTEVTLTSEGAAATFSATSDADGVYSFSGLSSGKYDLSMTKPGFIKYDRSIAVPDDGTRFDVTMKLDKGAVMGWQTPISLLHDHIAKLAGPDAVDCGHVGIRQSPQGATDCGLKAFSENRPFRLSYQLQGIDSDVAVGVVYTKAGEAFGADFDSMGWDVSGLPKDHVLSAENHIITYPCPKPVKFRKTRTGRLTCFPISKKKQTGNIMSPTFDPY